MTTNRTIQLWVSLTITFCLLAVFMVPKAVAPADAAALPYSKANPQMSEGTPFEEPENGGGSPGDDDPSDHDKPRTPDDPQPDSIENGQHTLPWVVQRVMQLARWLIARMP